MAATGQKVAGGTMLPVTCRPHCPELLGRRLGSRAWEDANLSITAWPVQGLVGAKAQARCHPAIARLGIPHLQQYMLLCTARPGLDRAALDSNAAHLVRLRTLQLC